MDNKFGTCEICGGHYYAYHIQNGKCLYCINKQKNENGVIMKHGNMRGMKVKDKVTGFVGVVTSVSLDIAGCEQVLIVEQYGKDKKSECKWIDPIRVEELERVLEPYGASDVGPVDKPTKE